MNYDILPADLNDPTHQQGIVELLQLYASEPTWGGEPLPREVLEGLIPALQQQSNGCHFLAVCQEKPVGIAVCFVGFSTFYARRLINIHDLAVHPNVRGQGIGRALLKAVEHEARSLDCCKVTLEVRTDNNRAQHLYRSEGFQSGDLSAEMEFWTKKL